VVWLVAVLALRELRRPAQRTGGGISRAPKTWPRAPVPAAQADRVAAQLCPPPKAHRIFLQSNLQPVTFNHPDLGLWTLDLRLFSRAQGIQSFGERRLPGRGSAFAALELADMSASLQQKQTHETKGWGRAHPGRTVEFQAFLPMSDVRCETQCAFRCARARNYTNRQVRQVPKCTDTLPCHVNNFFADA